MRFQKGVKNKRLSGGHFFTLVNISIQDIDHSRTKAKSPQTNGICERLRKTILNEFFQIAFRKKLYQNLEELQADADEWIRHYNEERPHSGKYCDGKTPMETSQESKHLAKDKALANQKWWASDETIGHQPLSETP